MNSQPEHIDKASLPKILLKLQEFDRLFPSEGDCIDELFRMLFPQGFVLCRFCNEKIFDRTSGSRVMLCVKCNRETWFTAQTSFNRVRKVRERLAIIFLMESGLALNAYKLQKALALAAPTAWRIFGQICAAVSEEMFGNMPTVCASHFRELIFRRSRNSIQNRHPVEELDEGLNLASAQHEVDSRIQELPDPFDSEVQSIKSSNVEIVSPDSSLSSANSERDLESKILRTLDSSEGKTLSFDRLLESSGLSYSQLCTSLVMLELKALIKRVPGDRYSRVAKAGSPGKSALTETIARAINKSKALLMACFQGVSLRYLQNYLAFSWIAFERDKWNNGQLMRFYLQKSPKQKILAFSGTETEIDNSSLLNVHLKP